MTTKKYKSGLTLTVEYNPAFRSVTAGVMIGNGSAYETVQNNGISHVIEHMLFKGTKKRTAEDIVNAFDTAGANYNAFTGKEYTCFYFKTIDEKTEECFEVLSDMYLDPAFDDTELDRERKVIIEEINMGKDEPDGVCYDTLYSTMFKGSLGMEIIGTKENVTGMKGADLSAFKNSHYLPSNTVIAFVGNITFERAEELVQKYFGRLIDAPYIEPPAFEKQQFHAGYGEYIKDFEQSEISVAYPALTAADEGRPALSVLDLVLGTGMGSRLFRQLREKMGLVYSVYSMPWLGKTNGTFSICANVNAENLEKCASAIRGEIDKLTDGGVTEDEVAKAKMQLKVSGLFGKENTMSYMLAMLRRRILADEDYDLDALIAGIDAVRPADVNALARKILKTEPAVAYAGKKPQCNIADIIGG